MGNQNSIDRLLAEAGTNLRDEVDTRLERRSHRPPRPHGGRLGRRWAVAALIAVVLGVLVVALPGSPPGVEVVNEPSPSQPEQERSDPVATPTSADEPSEATTESEPSPSETAEQAEVLPGWRVIGELDKTRLQPHVVATGGPVIVFGGNTMTNVGRGDSLFRDQWDGLLVDPATGAVRPMASTPLCGQDEARTVWTGRELVVWNDVAGVPDGCPRGAAYDPEADRWRTLDVSFFSEVGAAPVAWSGNEILAWTEGLALDPVTGTTRQFIPAPDLPALRNEMHSPPVAHWTGDQLVVLASSNLVIWNPESDQWSESAAPPIPGRARTSIWTGSELLTVNYEMDAATWTPSGGWAGQPPLPLRFYECLPRLSAGPTLTIAQLCSGIGIWDDSQQWSIIPRPTAPGIGGTTVVTDNAVLSFQDRILRYDLPDIQSGRLVSHPATFPINTYQFRIPDGWRVERTIGAEHREGGIVTTLGVDLTGPANQTCYLRGTYGGEIPDGEPTTLTAFHDGSPIEAHQTPLSDDGRAHVWIADSNGSDIIDIACHSLDDARLHATHLWSPYD